MSSTPGVHEVDGRLVAVAGGVEPPNGWTGDYDELGGDERWGKDGEIRILLDSAGVDTTNLKPLYAMEAWTGDSMVMFETGSPKAFYFLSPIDCTVYKITLMNDLANIVDWINDEDKGHSSLKTERII